MAINKKACKMKKFIEIAFVEVFFVGIVLVEVLFVSL